MVLQVLGSRAARDVSVTNLKGVGGIGKAEQVMRALADYVGGSVLIMDAEGDVKRVVERLVREGAIAEEDALVMKTSLEESNFSSEEMVSTALRIAAEPNEKRPAAELRLTAAELDAEHEKRLDRAGKDKPGKAGTLESMTRNPKYGPAPVTKVELATGLAALLLEELGEAKTDEQRASLYERRPVLGHIIKRIVHPLMRAPLDRPRRADR